MSQKCHDRERRFQHSDQQQILRWLYALKPSNVSMQSLREIFLHYEVSTPLYRVNDDQVLQSLSWLITDNRLHVCREPRPKIPTVVNTAKPGALAPAFPQAWLTPRAYRVESPRAPEVEQPTFPPSLVAAATAAIMQEAARLGVPFCEECLKAAIARGIP